MKKIIHLAFWTILVVLLSALSWLSVSLLEFDRQSREEQQKQKQNEQVRLCLWRMDSYLSHFLFEANRSSPRDFRDRQGINASGPQDNYAAAYFEIEHDSGVPFSSGQNTTPLPDGQHIARLADEIRNSGISRADANPSAGNTVDREGKQTEGTEVEKHLLETQKDMSDYGLWVYSSRHIPWKDSAFFFSPQELTADHDLNETVLYKTAFAPRWLDDDLVLTRLVETPWRTFTQVILLDWKKLRENLLSLTRDILPGASLAPYKDTDIKPDDVVRLLAGLPLIVDPGVPPATDGGQVTDTLKMSLLLIWGAALVAVAGAAALLFGMMRLNERRSMFVSAVTHELRTPLTTLDMYAEMLTYGFVPPDEYAQYFADMRQESGRLRRLIDNVLGFSRIERSVDSYKVSVISGAELSRDILACIAPIIKQSGMSIAATTSDEALKAEVVANREAVCQIMGNLADNAVKYALTLPGPVTLDINSANGFLEIVFQDSGPGIPPSISRKLFKPFLRTSAGDKAGMGLGLYLSRSMVRKMGGNLQFDRSIQPGAGFRLTLPLKKP